MSFTVFFTLPKNPHGLHWTLQWKGFFKLYDAGVFWGPQNDATGLRGFRILRVK